MKTFKNISLLTHVVLLAVLLTLSFPLFPPDLKPTAWASAGYVPLNDEPVPGKTFLPLMSNTVRAEVNWSTVAGNPERTSWTPTQIAGQNLHVEWYRPIEAYISQNVQIIASNGLLYISTAKGLYALNANNGDVVWRFDTELPLGNSPTVKSGILYVGGYDRKLHVLNALTGAYLWSFDGAKAGYDTNPLVVDGKVILGNRDGTMYAIGAHGSRDQGQLLWSFKAGGPIHLSAAYKDGVVYFAADDNYAYALNAYTGALVWKSAKLPGDGYHSFWPVIYQDKVIFSTAPGYRHGLEPGSRSVVFPGGELGSSYSAIQMTDLFPIETSDIQLIGPQVGPQDWSHGQEVINASLLTEYLEENPNTNPRLHKPWRRIFIILNRNNGREYNFDSDGDGYPEYAPFAFWGTRSGNSYPPIVGADNILYASNVYQNNLQGRVMGWKFGSQYLSIVGGQGASDEPQALSMGGNLIYRNLCCDRVGSYFDIREDGERSANLWSYDLGTLAPGYDEMWIDFEGWPRLHGWYQGVTNSVNGIYHNHGDQNPIVPYGGRLFVHRSNTIFAFGTGPARGKLPALRIAAGQVTGTPLSSQDLQARLETEIQKIVNAGILRPGYYNNGQFTLYKDLADYFENPGDTLYTLSIAYPYLSAGLQSQVKAYLSQYFERYFDPVMYSSTGWADGAAREAMPAPPEVEASFANISPREPSRGFSWSYPPHNFYAMWKYALIVPERTSRIYELAKEELQVPVPSNADNLYLQQNPYEINAYIAGYIGFLRLQELAGSTQIDAQLRTSVNNELNRLLALRANNFNKDTPWGDDRYHKKVLNIAQNFMMLVPELGDYLNTHALARVQTAISEYEYVAPYWFVSRYEAMINEGVMSPLYNYEAVFQAKAFINKETREELTRYLDVPGFAVGDLFYIQNVVAAIEAP